MAVSTTDEKTLGLNTAFTWTIDAVSGRKTGGTVKIKGVWGEEDYTLCRPKPMSRSYVICGRGTTCWRAICPRGRMVVIKYTWRSEDRVAERVHLETARGIRGIVELIDYEPEEISTLDLRNRRMEPDPGHNKEGRPKFCNYLGSCIVVKAYGAPLCGFTSEAQLLGALRDGLAGKTSYHQVHTMHGYIDLVAWLPHIQPIESSLN